jgi:hypothetical protein
VLVAITTLAGLPLFSVYFFKELLLCFITEQSLYIVLVIGLIFILEVQSVIYSFRILKQLIGITAYRTVGLDFGILTDAPIVLYSFCVLLIGRFLNIKLYSNNLILTLHPTSNVYIIGAIFIFGIFLLLVLVKIGVQKVVSMVYNDAPHILIRFIRQLYTISNYGLKVVKNLQLIYIKKIYSYLSNL